MANQQSHSTPVSNQQQQQSPQCSQSTTMQQNHNHETPQVAAVAAQPPRSSKSANAKDKGPFDGDQWVCVLCRKICHYRGLGDLYGPYNIDFSNAASSSDVNIEKCKPITPKKSKYSLLNHNYAVKEIWVHEDCLVWSEGVHLIGKKILKMEDTIKASFNHNCSICKVKGATIGCAGKRCRRKFHYVCGRDSNCLLDEANFTLKCGKCIASTRANMSDLIKP